MKTATQLVDGFQQYKDKVFKDKKSISHNEIKQLEYEYMQVILQEVYDKGHEDGYGLHPRKKIEL